MAKMTAVSFENKEIIKQRLEKFSDRWESNVDSEITFSEFVSSVTDTFGGKSNVTSVQFATVLIAMLSRSAMIKHYVEIVQRLLSGNTVFIESVLGIASKLVSGLEQSPVVAEKTQSAVVEPEIVKQTVEQTVEPETLNTVMEAAEKAIEEAIDLIAPDTTEESSEKPDLEVMSFSALKTYALENGISVVGLKSKAAILAKIVEYQTIHQ